MEQPTTSDDIAFWAHLVLANVWIASPQPWCAVPYIVMALAIRLPYWLRLVKRVRGA
jgi:hypothetical protein